METKIEFFYVHLSFIFFLFSFIRPYKWTLRLEPCLELKMRLEWFYDLHTMANRLRQWTFVHFPSTLFLIFPKHGEDSTFN